MTSTRSDRSVGRPRDPALDDAILSATLAVLRDQGYRGFSIEAVATRAGTSKPAIARRWARRQELILAALVTVVVTPPAPDTGCTRCDLIEGVKLLADALLRRMPPGVLAPLIADCTDDPGLHRTLTRTLVQPARAAIGATVSRAVERGHVRPGVDVELVVDVLAAVVFESSLFAETRFRAKRVATVVDLLLQGIAVDYDELLAISMASRVKHRHPTRSR